MLQPLGNHLTINSESIISVSQTSTPSGLALPEAEKARCKRARVEQVGAEIKGVHPGDTIIFNGFGGIEVFDGNLKLLLLTDKDLFGVFQ